MKSVVLSAVDRVEALASELRFTRSLPIRVRTYAVSDHMFSSFPGLCHPTGSNKFFSPRIVVQAGFITDGPGP